MSNTAELRRRKLKDSKNQKPTSSRKAKKPSTDVYLHRSLWCLILSGTVLTLFVVLYTDQIPWHLGHRAVDQLAKKFGYDKPVHAVVIDAGSTGSRVLAFTFHEAYLDGHLVLDRELFKQTKPGLSSFADEPQKAVASIASLLEEAKKEIPEQYWSTTPLILKATAGLRLLPQEKANKLLDSVRDLFAKTPFLTNNESVEIMDGTDEGIFSWFTVNFLLEKMSSPASTVAALDLGGGSTQITFSAQTPASLKETDFIHQAITPKGYIPVYTNSYLGLGLMAARKEIITKGQTGQTVVSQCVNPIIKNRKFTYGGVDYLVSGPKDGYPTSKTLDADIVLGEEVPIVDFAKCQAQIAQYIQGKAKAPQELPSKTIFAFSYYFDRAAEVGLIDEQTGGQIRLSDFKKAALEACHSANAEQPFMCLDLTFIWTLLSEGFGLNQSTKIYLFKKINGHEISWAMGAGYDLLRG